MPEKRRLRWAKKEIPGATLRGKQVMAEVTDKGIWVWKKQHQQKEFVSWAFIIEAALAEKPILE